MKELQTTSTFMGMVRGWELYERDGRFFLIRERNGRTRVRPLGRASAKARASGKGVQLWNPQQN